MNAARDKHVYAQRVEALQSDDFRHPPGNARNIIVQLLGLQAMVAAEVGHLVDLKPRYGWVPATKFAPQPGPGEGR